jgi:hypothetical protein
MSSSVHPCRLALPTVMIFGAGTFFAAIYRLRVFGATPSFAAACLVENIMRQCDRLLCGESSGVTLSSPISAGESKWLQSVLQSVSRFTAAFHVLVCHPCPCKLLNVRFMTDSTLTRFRHSWFPSLVQDFACGPSALPLRGITSRLTSSAHARKAAHLYGWAAIKSASQTSL